MNKPLNLFIILGLSASSLMAADQGMASPEGASSSLLTALLHCAAFGMLGIILVTIGFKLFDAILTKSDLEAEISKGNIAAAILSAAVLISIGLIVAAAIN